MTGPELIGSSGDSSRESFGRELARLGSDNSKILFLDGDVAGGTGGHHFRDLLPNQFIQCGIAEQNMVGVASGLALSGLIPVVGTFAAFYLRAIDQIRISVAYAHRNVKLVSSHAGLDVGPDGASAQCLEDIAIMRSLPGMTVVVPSSPEETVLATRAILQHQGPVYMRTGRSPSAGRSFQTPDFILGRASVIRQGSDLTIVACGPLVNKAVEAAERLWDENISVAVTNMSTIKPIDTHAIDLALDSTGALITLEDHSTIGGLGSAVAEYVGQTRPILVHRMGVDDTFGESGQAEELYEKYGLSVQDICQRVRMVLNNAD